MHDAAMLVMSGLVDELEQHFFDPNGALLCIYGDPAYPQQIHLQRPYQQRTPEQEAFAMDNFQQNQTKITSRFPK